MIVQGGGCPPWLYSPGASTLRESDLIDPGENPVVLKAPGLFRCVPRLWAIIGVVTEASRSLISGVPDKRFGSSVDCSTGVCAIREAVQTACVSNSHPVFVWVPQFSLQVHVERSRFSFTTVPHVPPLPFSFCFFLVGYWSSFLLCCPG